MNLSLEQFKACKGDPFAWMVAQPTPSFAGHQVTPNKPHKEPKPVKDWQLSNKQAGLVYQHMEALGTFTMDQYRRHIGRTVGVAWKHIDFALNQKKIYVSRAGTGSRWNPRKYSWIKK
jgi:hypothetical protein